VSGEFAGRLRERVIIEADAGLRGPGGLPAGQWRVVANVAAAVMPLASAREAEAMALSANPRFRVVIRAHDEVMPGQRLHWRGRILRLMAVTRDPRTPEAMELTVEEGAQ
jgi:SPP1 family predicted phage head-tail adaptor